MYKYLLCWRYLRTRYIALASIVSVTLGVATMIVVNSVMAGFADTMRERLHGTMADLVVETYDPMGCREPNEAMTKIAEAVGDRVEAMAPALETVGMVTVVLPNGQQFQKDVQIIGIRPNDYARTGDFAKYLFDQRGRPIAPSFAVDPRLRAASPAGRILAEMDEDDPFRPDFERHAAGEVPDHGIILGYALATLHRPGVKDDLYIAHEGAQVILTFPTAGKVPRAAQDTFATVGYFKSGMSEYDSTQVYVPIERLQELRGLDSSPESGAINQIRIKARPGEDLDRLAADVQRALTDWRPQAFLVSTWEQKQGPLLAAVAVEQGILNILLFLIIAVAGFGILAIFSMIVVEKTRDIGILRALGAPASGVRGIFLGYGLALGLVGAGAGMAGGLLFVRYINAIERVMSDVTGRKVFDDAIYYFSEIPTLVEPFTVAWIVAGAVAIAVGASVWPAQRAASLHPVRALRFE